MFLYHSQLLSITVPPCGDSKFTFSLTQKSLMNSAALLLFLPLLVKVIHLLSVALKCPSCWHFGYLSVYRASAQAFLHPAAISVSRSGPGPDVAVDLRGKVGKDVQRGPRKRATVLRQFLPPSSGQKLRSFAPAMPASALQGLQNPI